MREIKFRAAYFTDNGKTFARMIYGVGLREDGTPFKREKGEYYEIESDKDLDGAIPLQFTGLKDKNGKEIYEGDLMKIQDGSIADVYFDVDGCWCLSADDLRLEMLSTYENLEVVGNLYETPDLIPKQERE